MSAALQAAWRLLGGGTVTPRVHPRIPAPSAMAMAAARFLRLPLTRGRYRACYPDAVNHSGLKSSLLVAMPQLQDPNFHRTVLLMVEHDTSASFGLVLNRPAGLLLSELFSSLQLEWRGSSEATVAWGGPVEPSSGWMLFGDCPFLMADDEQVSPVAPGINFGGSVDVFQQVAESPPPMLRFFLGYSGWGPGQLEFEIAQGTWLSADAVPKVIFEVPPEQMWDTVVRGLGIDPSSLVSTTGVH